jgi:hypothetical protein
MVNRLLHILCINILNEDSAMPAEPIAYIFDMIWFHFFMRDGSFLLCAISELRSNSPFKRLFPRGEITNDYVCGLRLTPVGIWKMTILWYFICSFFVNIALPMRLHWGLLLLLSWQIQIMTTEWHGSLNCHCLRQTVKNNITKGVSWLPKWPGWANRFAAKGQLLMFSWIIFR